MLTSMTAYTTEIDDISLAVSEILAQLDLAKLKKFGEAARYIRELSDKD